MGGSDEPEAVAVLTFLLGIAVGMGFATMEGWNTVWAQQWVEAPNVAGVQVSQLPGGVTCYSSTNGGIACFR